MKAEDLTTGTRIRNQRGVVCVVDYVIAADSPKMCKVVATEVRTGLMRSWVVTRSQLFEVVTS